LNKQLEKKLGCIVLIVVAIIWGNGFVASEIALDTMTPIQILALRFVIAAIIMIMFSFKKLKNIEKELLKKGILLGVILYFAFAFQTVGLVYTTPSKNAFLTAVNVIIVPFIAFVINKKSVDKFGIVGAVLSIVGIGILSLNSNFLINKGDMLTLVCAFLFAFHIYYTGKFSKKCDFILLTTVQMVVAAILGVAIMLIKQEQTFILKSSSIISIIYLGVISTALAFILQTWGQKYTNETTAAVVLSMESVFGTISSIIIIKEIITGRMIVGSVLILIGVITSETKLTFLLKKKGA
jgi:drug/metabolite transporter (DMT)-like permease